MAARRKSKRKPSRKGLIRSAIQRPGALTRSVGGSPKKNLGKVRRLAKSGTSRQKRQAQFFLNVLHPAAKRKKKGS